MIKIADEFIIKLISDDFAEGVGGKGKGGVSGTAFGLGAKLGLGIGLATEALGLLKDTIGNVLRPVKTIIKGIFKLIGELLRPVTDVLILVLRPILIIIRPLIQLFKAFMAPFVSIAREFGRIATQQAAKGNIGLALEASVEGVKTLIAPFIISLVSVGLQLANTVIVGAITNLVSSMVQGIGALIEPIAEFLGFGDEFNARITEIVAFVSSQGDELNKNLNALMISGTTELLSELEKGAEENLTVFKTKLANGETTLSTSLTNMDVDMNGVFGSTGSIPTSYATGLNTMAGSTDSFVGRLQTAADAINAINVRGAITTAGESIIAKAGRYIAGKFARAQRLGLIPIQGEV